MSVFRCICSRPSKFVLVTTLALCAVALSGTAAHAQMAWTDRAFVNVNLGQQWMDQRLATSGSLPIYSETATWDATIDVDDSLVFDMSAGYRVWKNLAVGAGFSRTTDSHVGAFAASIPDILAFDAPHASSREVSALDREERAFHISATWMVPITDKLDVAVSAGPSFYSVTQPFVSGMTVASGTSEVGSVQTSALETSGAGYHVAADGTYRILRNVGIGGTLRYTAAKLDSPGLASATIDAGGFQGLVGARFRF